MNSRGLIHLSHLENSSGLYHCGGRDEGGNTSGDMTMNDVLYQRIEKSARFKELVRKRQSFATLLSVIMLVLYVGFIDRKSVV